MRPRPLLLALAVALVVAVGAATWIVADALRPPAPPRAGGLDVYGAVPPFALVDQAGRRVTREDLLGHVSVVDFMYTDCTDVCEMTSGRLASLLRELGGAGDLRVVSISVDPEHDTPAVLAAYAQRHGADPRWRLLTGPRLDIACLARRGFHLDIGDDTDAGACGPASAAAPPGALAALLGPAPAWAHGPSRSIAHTTRLAVVDRAARIRAYHLATDPLSMQALPTTLRRLLAEPAPRG